MVGWGLGNSRRGVDLGVDIGPDYWLAERMFNNQRAPENTCVNIQHCWTVTWKVWSNSSLMDLYRSFSCTC